MRFRALAVCAVVISGVCFAAADVAHTDSAASSPAEVDRSFLQWQVTPLTLTGFSMFGKGTASATAESHLDGSDLVLTVRPLSPKSVSRDSSLARLAIRLAGGSFGDGSRFKSLETCFGKGDDQREIVLRLPIVTDSRLSALCPGASSAELHEAIAGHPRPRPTTYVQSLSAFRGSFYLSGFDTPTWSVPVPMDLQMFSLRKGHWSDSEFNGTVAGISLAEIFLPTRVNHWAALRTWDGRDFVHGDTVKVGLPFSILPLSLTQYLAAAPHFTVAAGARGHPFMFLTYQSSSRGKGTWWHPVLDLSVAVTLWIGRPEILRDSAGGLTSIHMDGKLGVRLAVGSFLTGAPERHLSDLNTGEWARVPEPRGSYHRIDLLFGRIQFLRGTPAASIARWSKQIAEQISGRKR